MSQRQFDLAEKALLRELARLPDPGVLARVEVTPDADHIDAGTRPSEIMSDGEGRRYFFKAATLEHIAAEELAYSVRALGGRPTVPGAARTLSIGGSEPSLGILQPLIEHTDERLPTDPNLWSSLQREVMLREHPWEWLLANLDTHVDQYILIGAARHPLNIDWDHTLVDLDVTELTRFTKRRVTVAPIRNLLYDHFAKGAIDLSFAGLRREARRVRALDDRVLRRLVMRYASTLDKPAEEGRALAERLIERKHRIQWTFDRLVATMRLDRLRERRSAGPLSVRVARGLQAEWQRFVVQVLHDRVMRTVFRAKKAALARWPR